MYNLLCQTFESTTCVIPEVAEKFKRELLDSGSKSVVRTYIETLYGFVDEKMVEPIFKLNDSTDENRRTVTVCDLLQKYTH